MDPNLRQINPVHVLKPCFFRIHVNIILSHTKHNSAAWTEILVSPPEVLGE
jgi:hypothetical protein